MNKIELSGRLTRDPVKRATQTGLSVTNFSIAVRRPGTKKEENVVDFFDCVVWRGGADVVEKYFRKGDGIVLSGFLTNRKWEKDGVTHTSAEITVDDFEFPMGRGNGNDGGQSQTAVPEQAPEQGGTGMVAVDENEPLPF